MTELQEMRKCVYVSALFLLGSLQNVGEVIAGQDRLALVIGNSAYVHTARLKNPVNDAEAVSSALRNLGYGVLLGRDLTNIDMKTFIFSFSRLVKKAKVVVFFYAGHGMQVNGRNLLVPVDYDPASDTKLTAQLVVFDDVVESMSRGPKVKILILDACRNNPLAQKLRTRVSRGRSPSIDGTGAVEFVGQGLAEVKAGVGTLIVYATAPGSVAEDGAGKHSPFTVGLLKHIGTPGLEIGLLMRRVRSSVRKDTRGKQVPWEHSSLERKLYFKKRKWRVPPPPT